ncbi:hypothetical protein ACIBBE_46585 [Streptomyces sp. NPDC051644]|uniref:hypothetical protein n=1 Tax=Streptomyces sp. NPDC051644 TaxID=3365666 RepID=UPI00379CF505
MTTPADELRQAAGMLRDKATAATHEGHTRWATGHTRSCRSPVVYCNCPEIPEGCALGAATPVITDCPLWQPFHDLTGDRS